MKKQYLLTAILILALLITGCSRKNSTRTATDGEKGHKSSTQTAADGENGRFMEASISLPEDIGKDVPIQLAKINGMPGLYVYSKEGDKCIIKRYLMKENGTWTEETPEWLNSVQLSPDLRWLTKIIEDGNGNQYLYSLEQADDDQVKGMLLRSCDGKTYEKITPEDWNTINEDYGIYFYPELINVLSDGTIIALFFDGEITFYNKDTFKKEKKITGTHYIESILAVNDQSVYVGKVNDNYTLVGIDVYNANSTQKTASYPLSTTIDSYSYLDINENGDILVCNADGVHILEEDTTLWQTIIDGTLNSLSMQNKSISGFIAGSDTNYYVLFNTEQGYQLIKYYFDETINAVPSNEITVYTLTDNSTLRQAAAEFQASHPDVKVSIQAAMSRNEYYTATDTIKTDYIKSLNTELLAGKGPDILVLDGLPVDSLIEKGILTDLSDIINPMLENGELYENIIRNFFSDNKIYSVPVRFTLPLILSCEADASKIDTLESLAAYINDHPDQKMFGRSTYTDFISSYSSFLSARILNNDNSINRENLIAVLNQLKDISAAYELMDSYPDDAFRADGMWELASKTKLAISSCSGFSDSMYPIGFVTYVNGSFAPFDQTVIPSCEIGINSNSDNKDLCREFITVALSKEIGANDFYDGFSTNKEALLLCAAVDRSDYSAVSSIENEDGSSSQIYFYPLNEEQTQTLIQACTNADKIAKTDSQIISAIKEEARDLFTDSKSVEEIADQIIDNTKIYLSE